MLKPLLICDLEGVIIHIDYSKTFKKFAEFGISVLRAMIDSYFPLFSSRVAKTVASCNDALEMKLVYKSN